VTAYNRGCSVEALAADEDLTHLEGQFVAQLFLVRQVEWNFREGNFVLVNLV
jgi:hypothetical protein